MVLTGEGFGSQNARARLWNAGGLFRHNRAVLSFVSKKKKEKK